MKIAENYLVPSAMVEALWLRWECGSSKWAARRMDTSSTKMGMWDIYLYIYIILYKYIIMYVPEFPESHWNQLPTGGEVRQDMTVFWWETRMNWHYNRKLAEGKHLRRSRKISQAFHDSNNLSGIPWQQRHWWHVEVGLKQKEDKTKEKEARSADRSACSSFRSGGSWWESRRGNSTEARGNPGWKFLRRRLRGWSQTGGSTLELVRFFNQNHGCHSHDQTLSRQFWYSMRKLALFIDQCYSQCLSLFLPFL